VTTGTVTVTEIPGGSVKQVSFAWTSTAGGAAGETTRYRYTGNILKVVTVPGTAGAAPSADYDITIKDSNLVDVANGQLANRHTSNTELVSASLGAVVHSKLTIAVTNAGNAKSGVCHVYIGSGNELASSGTDIENGLYGSAGIASFPAAAQAGNGVSIAEVIRYISDTQLAPVVQSTVRASTVKAQASIATAALFTIAGGPVRVLSIVGQITTGLEAKANALKLTHTPTGGAAVDLCATVESNAAAIRKCLVLNGVKATALQITTDIGVVTLGNQSGMPIVLTAGAVGLTAADTATGAISWYMEYEPLVPGATVVAA
jgi:hypothetical protein